MARKFNFTDENPKIDGHYKVYSEECAQIRADIRKILLSGDASITVFGPTDVDLYWLHWNRVRVYSPPKCAKGTWFESPIGSLITAHRTTSLSEKDEVDTHKHIAQQSNGIREYVVPKANALICPSSVLLQLIDVELGPSIFIFEFSAVMPKDSVIV